MAWEQLMAILDERRYEAEQEATRVPVACPRCGEPLLSARGVLKCLFDGYEWDG